METEQETKGLEETNLDNVGQGNETDTKEKNPEQTQDNVSDNQEKNEKDLDNVGQNEDLYGAPESYDFKSIELPEGIQYNEEYGQKFADVAKELNLSQKSANKLINVYVDMLKSQSENMPEALKEFKKQQVQADVAEWDKMLNQDAEIGNGNEDKIEKYIDKANVGYKAFASEGLKKVLSERGLTHNPEVIKLFYKLSNLAGEDGIVVGSQKEVELTPAQILYGEK